MEPASAKAKSVQRATQKEINAVMQQHTKYIRENNFEAISQLYAPQFFNSDGYNQEEFLKRVKATWLVFPAMDYDVRIKNIDCSDRFAMVEVYEQMSKASEDVPGLGAADIFSAANTVYYLEKTGDDWLIYAEQLVDEKLILRVDDARFMKMDLTAPAMVGVGTSYSAILNVDASEDISMYAVISNAKVVDLKPAKGEIFRQLPGSNTLERVLNANKDGTNEYAIAHAVLQKTDKTKNGGWAFVMTKVTVVKAAEDENAK